MSEQNFRRPTSGDKSAAPGSGGPSRGVTPHKRSLVDVGTQTEPDMNAPVVSQPPHATELSLHGGDDDDSSMCAIPSIAPSNEGNTSTVPNASVQPPCQTLTNAEPTSIDGSIQPAPVQHSSRHEDNVLVHIPGSSSIVTPSNKPQSGAEISTTSEASGSGGASDGVSSRNKRPRSSTNDLNESVFDLTRRAIAQMRHQKPMSHDMREALDMYSSLMDLYEAEIDLIAQGADETCIVLGSKAGIPDMRGTLDEPRVQNPDLASNLMLLYEAVEEMQRNSDVKMTYANLPFAAVKRFEEWFDQNQNHPCT